ncbi:MAG: phosphoribosylglycinamide formyltransferase [Candidatus Micrarchaeota archaeon]|nr:phosphoribosylglycinamide formyltransferase [Candidatus Micrarchaeota archaeon]
MVNIVVLASGSGSNFEAIVRKSEEGINIKVLALITDNPQAYAIQRANNHGIKVEVLDFNSFKSREAYEDRLFNVIDSYCPDIVVLAGYMRIIKSRELLNKYKYRIINLHPSLLPSFPGKNGISDAYNYGVKVTGITIHFVDEGMDTGPIIFQKAIRIKKSWSLKDLENKIHELEYRYLWRVINSFNYGTYIVQGRRTIFIRKSTNT